MVVNGVIFGAKPKVFKWRNFLLPCVCLVSYFLFGLYHGIHHHHKHHHLREYVWNFAPSIEESQIQEDARDICSPLTNRIQVMMMVKLMILMMMMMMMMMMTSCCLANGLEGISYYKIYWMRRRHKNLQATVARYQKKTCHLTFACCSCIYIYIFYLYIYISIYLYIYILI